MNDQLPALTTLRGFAALFILIHHSVGIFLPEIGQHIVQFTPFIRKSYLWVDFYFMLSGFILMHVYRHTFQFILLPRNYKAFIISRFARIYPLHLIMLLCFVCLAVFQTLTSTGPGFSGNQSLFSLATNLTLLQAIHYSSWNEPAWAISAQWLLYFTIPLMIYFYDRTSRSIDMAAIVLSYLALFVLNWWAGNLDFVGWKSFVRCGAEMITGVLAYKYQSQIHLNRFVTATRLTAGLSAIVLVSLYLPINHTITVCIFPFLIISASNVSSSSVFYTSSLIFLGTISYSLYMIHWFFMMLFNTIFIFFTGRALHLNFTLSLLFPILIAFIILNILLASVSYRYVELPLRKWIKNFFQIGVNPVSS
jgi:peptidoglycan/LPS O-acetylase OafA/YrhL